MLKNSTFAFIAAFAVSFAGAVAQAAFVTPSNSATFAFDMSGIGDTLFTGLYWCGDQENICGNDAANTLDEELAVGATMQLDFGTFVGGSDIGTSTFTNGFSTGIDNVSAPNRPNQAVFASLTTLYVTLVFVDDIYGASRLGLTMSNGQTIFGELLASEVPLPAALPLFLGGIAGIGFVSKAKRRRA